MQGVSVISISLPRTAPASEIQYMIGSHFIGDTPSKAVIWNTGYASDGTYNLQVIARNRRGDIIATARQPFIINNHGNSLRVSKPDLTHPVSGKIALSISGKDSQYYPALWMINVDGESPGGVWTDNTGLSVMQYHFPLIRRAILMVRTNYMLECIPISGRPAPSRQNMVQLEGRL